MPTLNELLHAASRTFAVGIDRLPSPLRGEVEVAYLLLRVSDYLEDNESMEPDRKAGLLERWAGVLCGGERAEDFAGALGPLSDPTPDALVARNLTQVVEALDALRPEAQDVIRRHVVDSTRGMTRWVLRGSDLANEADLDDYMHEVAGRVGWLLTELFALEVSEVDTRKERMMQLGREFGLALQTVNVIRGLHADWRRGWVYVPRSFSGDGSGRHPPPGTLFTEDADPTLEARVLERLVAKADRHLEVAAEYIALIPRRCHRIRLFCLLPYLFAVRTLALSRGNRAVFRRETKIPRTEVRQIVRTAGIWGWSNGWIGWYAGRLAKSVVVIALGVVACASPPPPLTTPGDPFFSAVAPDSFDVEFATTKGDLTVRVRRDWAPNGADRFHALVRGRFYDGQAYFRVIRGFVAQFGLHGDTAVSDAWKERRLPDDSIRAENVRGTLSFSRAGPNSRTTQLFFNLGDNRRLDRMDGYGFAPIGRVIEGLPVLDPLNPEYSGPAGRELPDGPNQDSARVRGDAYLLESFPRLDRIERARVVQSWR